jgi:hypothetical protein
MFVLACFVPAVLAGGAGLLLQPLHVRTDEVATRGQLLVLADRLSELDQLLYVGALALVFGTLQLSAALSVPLAEAPKVGDLKTMADICKTLAPTPASSPFFSASSVQRGLSRCNALPEKFERSEQTDSLRQLVRGVTLSFGLAFTALLAAIYVPALIGLRLMIDPRRASIRKGFDADAQKESGDAIGDVDPLRRVAAILATLSPLIAGLVANALAGG